MKQSIQDKRVRFFLGDIRNFDSVSHAVHGADYVFHAAALKHVPAGELFPWEFTQTNIGGSHNLLRAIESSLVQRAVFLSTDKAVYPVNAMGMTKSLMEKVAQSCARSFSENKTKISITRYGNVMMSRGSVIPLFLDQIRKGEAISITNPAMTRFMMSLEDSVSLVKYAFTNASNGDLFVRKAPACSVETLVAAVIKIMRVEGKVKVTQIGTRHGEKLYESLLGNEEGSRAIDRGDYFQVPLDSRSLDYQIYFNKGQIDSPEEAAYTSHNTHQLNIDQVVDLISNLPEFIEYKARYL
jgi:UDP-glucose 4-epimerase